MSKTYHDLKNCLIKKVQMITTNGVFDFWEITTDFYSMGVYNPMYIVDGNGRSQAFKDKEVQILQNQFIREVVFEENKFLCIIFGNGNSLLISLKEDDFKSAEAVEVHFSTGEIMIFN